MKIAILAPANVHNVIGGAENLYVSLCNYINERTVHECEIVSLISPESNFEEVINSYRQFSELNLDHFDCVISTKYPSWMISHKNHVCYMLHTLRGLYDTYHFMQLPYEVDWEKEGLVEFKEWMTQALQNPLTTNDDLKIFFAKLDQIIADKRNTALLNFPGPFIRHIVHFLDAYALSSSRVKNHFAISKTVAQRESYFPKEVKASALYPAPLLKDYRSENFDYIFTVSRLDAPKRIDLIINAMKHVDKNVSLIIAGEGPEQAKLKKLARNNKRIKFIGYLSDEELIEYYANALAIVFVPHDEDYGYITIEAMKSSKPVVTTIDSGGPNEFIRDGENGFAVQPEPKSIAEKINYLAQNVEAAQQMGRNAQETVKNILWDNAVEQLLSVPKENSKVVVARQKMLVLAPFPIYPAMGGGQVRILNLYRHLAKYYDIEILSICRPENYVDSREIAPGLLETRVAVTSEFISYEQELSGSVNWVPVTDIALIEGYRFIPKLIPLLKQKLESAEIAILSHPFLISAVREANVNVRIWYESHNIEYGLKNQILPEGDSSQKLLTMVFNAEGDCWKNSEVVFACSENDCVKMSEIYGPSSAIQMQVPNGVDFDKSIFLDSDQKNHLKKKLGLSEKNTVLFMGSWHGPNLEALEHVIELADRFPETCFFVVGSSGFAVRDRTLPNNIILFGELNDNEKQIVMSAADVAVNPMKTGSGSNLKMLDYFSYGLPVISTSFGVRGINVEPSKHYINADIKSFSLELCKFLALNDNHTNLRRECRNLVKDNYAWNIIADAFFSNLKANKIG